MDILGIRRGNRMKLTMNTRDLEANETLHVTSGRNIREEEE
jgi:hypothetical protein